jgi:hypothetical protein
VVQQISALIVQPAVDATKYTAGAQEKVAADRAMAASSREAGAALVDTSAKISTSGDVLARLSRQYVEGYATQQRFNQGLNQLNRGLETGKINVEGAERILVGMNQRLGLMANASDLAAKGQNDLAAAVTRANAQIERQATEIETSSRRIQAANNNRSGNFAAINATSQLQDIFVSAQGGQKVQTIALQQGTQLGMALQASLGEEGAAGAAKTLGSAILGLFSPINLISIGITAAAAATIQWFSSGEAGAKKMDTALKDHSETLRLLKQQYGDLGTSAKTLGVFGGAAFTDAEARSSQTVLQAVIRSQTAPYLDTLGGNGISSNLFGRNGNVDALRNLSGDQRQFAAPVQALIESAKSGRTDLSAFNDQVERLYDALASKSGNPTALRNTADAVELLGQSAFEVSGKFAPFTDAINKLRVEGSSGLSAFIATVNQIGRTTGLQKLADEAIVAGKEIVGLSEKLREVEEILKRIDRENTRPGLRDQRDLRRYVAGRDADVRIVDQQFAADQQLARARTNAERLAAIEAQVRARAKQDGDSGGGLQSRVDRALAEERTRQEVEARDATIQRSQAIQRTLDQQRLELDLVGKTTGEQAKLRFEFERMQELREQAARTGDPIDQKEIDKIKAAADAMKQYSDALARAKLGDDLQFERDQLFRAPGEQQIASRLRGTGLGMNSAEAQALRENQQIEQISNATDAFVTTFQSTLVSSGGDIGKSFSKAFRDAMLTELADVGKQAMQNLASVLTKGIASALGVGGSVSTGGVSAIAKAANDNLAAPIGTVIRSALPNIGAGSSYSVASATDFIKQYSSAIGIDPDIALRVAKSEGLGNGIWQSNAYSNGIREPSFGPFQLLKGGKGAGFGAGLGNKFMAQTGLDPADPANWQQSTAFALDQAKANGWGAWYGAKGQGITGFMGINQSASKAVGALDKLSTSSIDTAKNLSSGLGNLGSALNQPGAAASGGGGGGLFGWLGSLFGGGTTRYASEILSGARVGLFADGTENAPPGWAWVGERGPELMRMRGGEVVRNNQKSIQMAGGGTGASPHVVVPTVRMYIDEDDKWTSRVEEIAQGPAEQQSSKAVGSYAYQQRQGGAARDDHYYQRLKRRN